MTPLTRRYGDDREQRMSESNKVVPFVRPLPPGAKTREPSAEEGVRLIRAFQRVRQQKARAEIIALAERLAGETG